MSRLETWLQSLLIGFCMLCAGPCALIFSAMAWQAAGYPYNSEGRYYDGMVVHHAGAEIGWTLIALGLWLAVLLLAWLLARTWRGQPE